MSHGSVRVARDSADRQMLRGYLSDLVARCDRRLSEFASVPKLFQHGRAGARAGCAVVGIRDYSVLHGGWRATDRFP